MTGQFAGMGALVTGASYGIGAAAVERLAAEGADVALVARTLRRSDGAPGSLEETAERVRRHATNVAVVRADLSHVEDRGRIVSAAVDDLGRPIDILVNNAAMGSFHSTLDYSLDRRRLMFETNVEAPIDLMQAVVPGMRERGRGWIVNISSGTALARPGPPFPGGFSNVLGVYGATKAALNRITHAFAAELHGSGVRVNALQPRAAVLSDGAKARGTDMIDPDDVEPVEAMVEAIVALCECDEDRTGQTFVSLDLLQELGRDVMSLDGSGPLPR